MQPFYYDALRTTVATSTITTRVAFKPNAIAKSLFLTEKYYILFISRKPRKHEDFILKKSRTASLLNQQ
jgi:uncharacterized protein (DUF4213/DUF364 family)